jgi:sulfoxide reductase heme-binding subunit YedZ
MDFSRILQIAVHLGGILPAVILLFSFFTGDLTANPIQALEQRTGIIALNFLLLSLACTPVSIITGYKKIVARKKALGNYAFLYASIHFLIFIGLDYGFDLQLTLTDVGTKKFILFGLTALLLLLPLAVTSLNYWKKKLGPRWKTLHKLVYIISPIVTIHFLLSLKGDISQLQGNIVKPLVYGGVILFLLLTRIPFVKAFLARRV